MNRQIVGPLVAGLAFAALYASPASADLVYSLDSSTAFGSGSYGSVTLHQEASGVVEVTVKLTSGEGFTNTGTGAPIGFDITGNPTITETDFNNTAFSAGSVSSGQSNKFDGAGDFQYDVSCGSSASPAGCGTGGNSPNPGPLSFDVTATTGPALTVNSFVSNGTSFFASDICKSIVTSGDKAGQCAAGSNTGIVYGGPVTIVTVPEPMTLVLFGAGLLGLGAIGGVARRAKGRAS